MLIRSEANRVQNKGIGKNGHRNKRRANRIGSNKQRLIVGLILDYR